MNPNSESEKVICFTGLYQLSNKELFDADAIFANISQYLENYFRKNSIFFEIAPLSGMGGGADTIDSFLTIIQQIWSHKGFISALFYMVTSIYTFLPKLVSKLSVKIDKEFKPVVVLNLFVWLNETPEEDNILQYEDIVRNKLMNLKLIWENLVPLISKEYPLYKFDSKFGLKIPKIAYDVDFKEDTYSLGDFNKLRCTQIIKSTKVYAQRTTSYIFNRLFVIRYDYEVKRRRENPININKKYYLILSSSVLGD